MIDIWLVVDYCKGYDFVYPLGQWENNDQFVS